MPLAIAIVLFAGAVCMAAKSALGIEVSSGTNALNASIVLAIMALPTIISISQDALAAVGRDMREGSLALGATRFETIFKVVLPCAKSGIAVAVILGLMRVVGETMVVWMASGNALKSPSPFTIFSSRSDPHRYNRGRKWLKPTKAQGRSATMCCLQ